MINVKDHARSMISIPYRSLSNHVTLYDEPVSHYLSKQSKKSKKLLEVSSKLFFEDLYTYEVYRSIKGKKKKKKRI